MSRTNTLRFALLIALGLSASACASNAGLMKANSVSGRTDIFVEVADAPAVPVGSTDLEIVASVKTPPQGHFLLESASSPHGKPGYPFLLNIDGQAVVWTIDGQKETAGAYFANGTRNPERGTGVKYRLARRIRLSAGAHKVFFGLPREDALSEFDVALKGGRIYELDFNPLYAKQPKRPRNFASGVDGIGKTLTDVTLDRIEAPHSTPVGR